MPRRTFLNTPTHCQCVMNFTRLVLLLSKIHMATHYTLTFESLVCKFMLKYRVWRFLCPIFVVHVFARK